MEDKGRKRLRKFAEFESRPAITQFKEILDQGEKLDELSQKTDIQLQKSDENIDVGLKSISLLEDISEQVKKNENVEYELSIDDKLREDLRGKDGETPTDEKLVSLIVPLIPPPVHGTDGKNGKDGKKPTKKELRSLIKPLIPTPKDGKAPTESELRKIIKPLIPPAVKGLSDTPLQIAEKLNTLDRKVDWKVLKNIPRWIYDGKTIVKGSGSSGGSALTVSSGATSVSNVTGIDMDAASGFSVVDNGDGTVTVSLGSSFKTWHVAGQDDLVASGEDEITIAAGTGISLTTQATAPKTLTITADMTLQEVTNSGATTTVESTFSGGLVAPHFKANSSAGAYLKSTGGDVALFGAGGGNNITFYDGVKLNSQTASRILSTDASSNITALNTTTYPDLTELSYVKGVTSAIQTQLNAKGTLSNVVEDTTPQLGGSLDVNGQKIVSTSNGNIDIEPNGTGNVLLGNFTFDADQTVGAGQDNYVLTYDNATGLISLEASAGGGGTPGGSSTQMQYNNAGAFGGVSGVITSGSNLKFNDNVVLGLGTATGTTSDYDATLTYNGSNLIVIPDAVGGGYTYMKKGGTTSAISGITLETASLPDALILSRKSTSSTATNRTSFFATDDASNSNGSRFVIAFNAFAYKTGTGDNTAFTSPFLSMYAGHYAVRIANGSGGTVTWGAGTVHNIDLENGSGGSITNGTGAFFAAHRKLGTASGNVVNAYGAYFEKQTIGSTSNTGIFLAGDGVGSDIKFGAGGDANIYYDGTDLVIDSSLVGSGTINFAGQTASTITTETLSEYVTVKINGVSKKLAIVA